MRIRDTRVVIALACAALALGGCGGGDDTDNGETTSASSGTPTIKFGHTPGAPSAAIKLAEEKGFFKDAGVNVEIKPVAAGGGAGTVPQVLNGQLDLVASTPTAVIAARENNIPIQIAGGYSAEQPDERGGQIQVIVPGDSKIKSLSDLSGKNLGAASLQSSWELYTRDSIKQAGSDPKGPKFVIIAFPDQIKAMNAGRVDGIVTGQPFAASAVADGARSLGTVSQIALGSDKASIGVIFGSEKWLSANRDAVDRFNAGLQKASDYANENTDEMIDRIATETGLPAAALEGAPLPRYTTVYDRNAFEREQTMLGEYGELQQKLDVDDVFFAGAPTGDGGGQ